MGELPYADLRGFIAELERRGKLHRWQRPVNKDREMGPLMRLQYRGMPEDQRQAFLFEHVVDSKGKRYDMSVLMGGFAGSRSILALGMGCEDPGDIYERWHHAVDNPLPPVMVESAPVHEEVHTGPELAELGLAELPAPVEECGFSGGIRTTTPFITRHPETGVRNVGTYSGHFRSRDTLVTGIASIRPTAIYHLGAAKTRQEPLPVAITVGTLPDIVIAGAANLPYGVDELGVAGGLRGRPVEMVRCKTIPLEVPAEAEIVIEAMISFDEMAHEEAFSDYPGYLMAEHTLRPLAQVMAITHRRNAIFTPILVGLPPSECNNISRTCREMILYQHLKYGSGHPEVLEVCCPEAGGGWNWWVIRIKKSHPSQPGLILQSAAGMHETSKVIIVVDEDIDPKDPDMVIWALSYAMQPHLDTQVITGRSPALDPSAHRLMRTPHERGFPGMVGCSGLLIDATRKGAYPPVGLPTREFMEAAIDLWKDEGLPELKLRQPWYGYKLRGLWTEEDDELARRAVAGEALRAGELLGRENGAGGEVAAGAHAAGAGAEEV
jgi:4-hydroxy-3-polyprenylbenzoate decarboxylase